MKALGERVMAGLAKVILVGGVMISRTLRLVIVGFLLEALLTERLMETVSAIQGALGGVHRGQTTAMGDMAGGWVWGTSGE